jgi:hypothetical protein
VKSPLLCLLATGCALGGKSGALGACEFDASGWSHSTYRFSDTSTYLGCQSYQAETWYVSEFDGVILTDADAAGATSAAATVWNGPLEGWSFGAIVYNDPPQIEDEQSAVSASVGYSSRANEMARTWKYVSTDGDDLECEITVYTQLIDDAATVWDLTWVRGAGAGYDLDTFLLHEMGHCLGLGHPSSASDYPNSVMQEEIGVSTVRMALDAIDVEAVEFLYESADATTTGSTTTTP